LPAGYHCIHGTSVYQCTSLGSNTTSLLEAQREKNFVYPSPYVASLKRTWICVVCVRSLVFCTRVVEFLRASSNLVFVLSRSRHCFPRRALRRNVWDTCTSTHTRGWDGWIGLWMEEKEGTKKMLRPSFPVLGLQALNFRGQSHIMLLVAVMDRFVSVSCALCPIRCIQ
jgi:hypothetical protein